MLHELNQSACSAPKSRPRKFQTFEKVQPRDFRSLLRTLFRSWFLQWKHTEYRPKVPCSWVKYLWRKQGFSLNILCSIMFEGFLQISTVEHVKRLNKQLNKKSLLVSVNSLVATCRHTVPLRYGHPEFESELWGPFLICPPTCLPLFFLSALICPIIMAKMSKIHLLKIKVVNVKMQGQLYRTV